MDDNSDLPDPAQADPTAHGPLNYLTYDQLSQITGISLSTLRRRVKDGTIPFFQPGGPRTRVVFPLDLVERLMKSISISGQSMPDPSSLKQRRLGPQPKWQRGNQQ